MDALLSVRNVAVRFGGIAALDDVSFDVHAGEICGIIGPNGAGKTTLFNCLSRLYTPHSGSIIFDGHALLAVPAHRIAKLGIGRTFQNVALFPSMTVLENIMIGRHSHSRTGYVANMLRLPWVTREEAGLRDAAERLIGILNLTSVAAHPVSSLPFGTRKRVEMARALASEPKLLLLDEPAGGLNHDEVDELRDVIRDTRDRLNTTVLLVEHHLNLVMRVSDNVVVVNFGRKIAEGPPAVVQGNADVIQAYLGGEEE